MVANSKTKLTAISEFLHNSYVVESVHDSDHNGVVRTFVRLLLWDYYMEHFPPTIAVQQTVRLVSRDKKAW